MIPADLAARMAAADVEERCALARFYCGRGELGKAFDTLLQPESFARVDRFGRRAVCIPCRDCDGGAWFVRDADGRWGLVSDDCTCPA